MASNFEALWPTNPKFSALKDLSLFSNESKAQEASSFLKVGFALSKWLHLHRAYLVTVYNQNFIAVDEKILAIICSLCWIDFSLFNQKSDRMSSKTKFSSIQDVFARVYFYVKNRWVWTRSFPKIVFDVKTLIFSYFTCFSGNFILFLNT